MIAEHGRKYNPNDPFELCCPIKLKSALYPTIIALALPLAPFGCSPNPSMEDYKETLRDGIRSVPHVREIITISKGAPTDHLITHFGFSRKPVTWNTEVFFGGRYVLTYQIDVIINYRTKKIVRTATEPKFYLNEVTKVANASGENVTATMAKGYKFGGKEWEKVIGANGDFAVIGIILNTNAPVSGFDDYVRAIRRDRVPADP